MCFLWRMSNRFLITLKDLDLSMTQITRTLQLQSWRESIKSSKVYSGPSTSKSFIGILFQPQKWAWNIIWLLWRLLLMKENWSSFIRLPRIFYSKALKNKHHRQFWLNTRLDLENNSLAHKIILFLSDLLQALGTSFAPLMKQEIPGWD